MDNTLLYKKIQDLVPGYRFSDEDLKLIVSGINSNQVDLNIVESKSTSTYDALISKYNVNLDNIRLYIIKLMLGGVDLLPSQMVNEQTNGNEVDPKRVNSRFSIDRSENGSIKLNVDYMRNNTNSLFIDNNTIVYKQSELSNIINMQFSELKTNVKPYKEDLRSKVDRLLEQIAELKSQVQEKDNLLLDKNNTINSLNDTISSLENNYNQLVDQIEDSISNSNSESISNIQQSINDIYVQLEQNKLLDSDQQQALDLLPTTIGIIVRNILNQTPDDDGTDSGDRGPDTDVDFGEGTI